MMTIIAEDPRLTPRKKGHRYSIEVIEYDRNEMCSTGRAGEFINARRVKVWRVRRSGFERAMKKAKDFIASNGAAP